MKNSNAREIYASGSRGSKGSFPQAQQPVLVIDELYLKVTENVTCFLSSEALN